jgi:hypothetical protein
LQAVTLSRQNPVLMIFEDAQWADPTSLELFSNIVDRIPTVRVLLVMTYRPEFQPPWLGRPHVTVLTINQLAAREEGDKARPRRTMARCTPALPTPSKAASLTSLRTGLKFWRATALRPGRLKSRPGCGVKQVSGRWRARRS